MSKMKTKREKELEAEVERLAHCLCDVRELLRFDPEKRVRAAMALVNAGLRGTDHEKHYEWMDSR